MKCGIDVDPDIQDKYPSCGRRIKAVAQSTLRPGEVYQDSDLWIGYFVPDSRAWDDGDRIMHCYLYLPDAMLDESRVAG